METETNLESILKENSHLFSHPDLSEEQKNLLADFFLYKQKLITDIKDLEDELVDVQCEIEQIDTSEDEANKNLPRLRQMSIGKKKFNTDSKKGMEFLIENNLVENDVKSVGHFLFNSDGLNKTSIGNYLGERDDFNIKVLKEFTNQHDFKSKNLVEALRDFLSSFRLPGESQKIDRMMESFSQRFCECNETMEIDSEKCYLISYAIIMLNTSLHNPSVKDKQTCDQFVKMCKETTKIEVSEQMLKEFYTSIKKEQFKLFDEKSENLMLSFVNPIREGWLWKQGGRYKTWKQRWFILAEGCLYYFESKSDKEPRGIIPLENVNVRQVDDKTKQFCFEIYSTTTDKIKACKHDSEGKVIEGN
jgi:cytohesin